MSIQVKTRDLDKAPDYNFVTGEVIIKADGRVLYQSMVEVSLFWVTFLELIEKFVKKKRKTMSGYYHTNFCIDRGKRKDEIMFWIESPDRDERIGPIHLNKREFFEKIINCALSTYRELPKLEGEGGGGYDYFVDHYSELKKHL